MDEPVLEITVEGLAGFERIDNYLHKHPSVTLSKGAIQKLFGQGGITVNNAPAKKGNKVKNGSVIRIVLPSNATPDGPSPSDIPLTILHQDDHIIIVNKQAGLAVHAARDEVNNDTLVNALLHHCGASGLSDGEEKHRPGIVHRLDKGVMVICRTNEAHAVLKAAFETHTNMTKTYHAIVRGHLPQKAGQIVNYIGRHPKVAHKMEATNDPTKGKQAITNYRVLKEWTDKDQKLSLLEIVIETGRTHQIRVTFSVLGDPIYHKHDPKNTQSMCLLAKQLQFDHPVLKNEEGGPKPMDFTVDYPPNFEWFLQSNRKD